MKEYFHVWNIIFEGLPNNFWNFIKYNSDLKYAFENATKRDFLEAGVKAAYYERLKKYRDMDPSKLYKKVTARGYQMLTYRDEKYPFELRDLNNHHSPMVLYIKGRIPSLDRFFLSIVGTRRMSGYGEKVTKNIVKTLGEYNPIIVSGMAYGIDSTAHKEALRCGLKTIAVLGFGFNKIPYHLKNFAEKIAQNGALISEYPPDTDGQKYHFPLRNRIISGISNATIVVEAPERSGALITAQCALDQGKEVFAIPGDIDQDRSKGSNKLLSSSSAHALVDPEDVLTRFYVDERIEIKPGSFDEFQLKILDLLKSKPLLLTELLNNCQINQKNFYEALIELELAKIIEKDKNGRYFIR